jgi:hypothetical protein
VDDVGEVALGVEPVEPARSDQREEVRRRRGVVITALVGSNLRVTFAA